PPVVFPQLGLIRRVAILVAGRMVTSPERQRRGRPVAGAPDLWQTNGPCLPSPPPNVVGIPHPITYLRAIAAACPPPRPSSAPPASSTADRGRPCCAHQSPSPAGRTSRPRRPGSLRGVNGPAVDAAPVRLGRSALTP